VSSLGKEGKANNFFPTIFSMAQVQQQAFPFFLLNVTLILAVKIISGKNITILICQSQLLQVF